MTKIFLGGWFVGLFCGVIMMSVWLDRKLPKNTDIFLDYSKYKVKRPRPIQIKRDVAHAQSKGCYLFVQVGTTAIYCGNRQSDRQGLQIRICTPYEKFRISYD